jgi:c(7)-type cytochrome triheme protein
MKLPSILLLASLIGSATLANAVEIKDIVYNTPDAGKVVFSHMTHFKKKSIKSANINCKACHSSNMQKNVRYTMADMERGKSCGICHNGKAAFDLNRCAECHKVREITYKVKETGPVVFSHSRHLRSMQCKACHNAIYVAGPNKWVGMAAMEKGSSCGKCHNGNESFAISECGKCHPMKEVTFKVKDAGDVKFSHKSHNGMYKCGDCHTKLYLPASGNKSVAMAGMETGKSCGACHDGKTAFTVKDSCDKCHMM